MIVLSTVLGLLVILLGMALGDTANENKRLRAQISAQQTLPAPEFVEEFKEWYETLHGELPPALEARLKALPAPTPNAPKKSRVHTNSGDFDLMIRAIGAEMTDDAKLDQLKFWLRTYCFSMPQIAVLMYCFGSDDTRRLAREAIVEMGD